MNKLSLILFVIVLAAVSNFAQIQIPKESVETKFLEQFVGVWVGEGESLGGKTTDEMKFSWLFNKRFLKMNYRTLKGKDTYTSEGFIMFNSSKKLFEYYDFNDGLWAVRQGLGRKEGNSLIVNENRVEDRLEIQLTFEFSNPNTLKVVEYYTQNGIRKSLADYTFKRKSAKSR